MKKHLTMAATLAALSGAASAGVVYQFSFTNVVGNTAGTVTGLITLDFLAASGGSGVGAASDIRITSAPVGIPAAVEGADITDWRTQVMNRFEVVNGVIVDYEFGAAEGLPSTSSDNVLCLNNGPRFNFPAGAGYYCGINENYYGDGSRYVYNVGGIQAVTFVEQVGSVPVAGSLPLSALALGLMVGVARRRIA